MLMGRNQTRRGLEIQQRDARVEATWNMGASKQQKNWNLGRKKMGSIYKKKTNLKSHRRDRTSCELEANCIGSSNN